VIAAAIGASTLTSSPPLRRPGSGR
jgi:hypothetical protein